MTAVFSSFTITFKYKSMQENVLETTGKICHTPDRHKSVGPGLLRGFGTDIILDWKEKTCFGALRTNVLYILIGRLAKFD